MIFQISLNKQTPLPQKQFNRILLLSLFFLLTLSSCQKETPLPELIPLADTPVLPTQTATLLPPTYTPLPATATSIPTMPPFTPRVGLRPENITQYIAPDIPPLADYPARPAPMMPPLSYHPNDHYWLVRSIPSDQRNYPLEWYPYGNDVLIERLAPYRIHHGEDYPNPSGTQILAASSGTVIWAGPLPSTRNGVNYYGNTVIIHHDWEWEGRDVYTLYAHTLELFVAVGDLVSQGQLIAGVGASGEVSGSHLHLEVRVGENDYGATRNPALWVVPYEGWGTLAGRFADRNGNFIHGARVTLYPKRSTVPFREIQTYASFGVNPDERWQENFVIPDIPAGEYVVELETRNTLYRHDIQIRSGQTSFVESITNFSFVPTRIPTSTPIPTITPITPTIGITLTLPITP